MLKILNVTRLHSSSGSDDEKYGTSGPNDGNEGGSSGVSSRPGRRSVQVEEELDLQGGAPYSGVKNSKTALINDVGWGYDCKHLAFIDVVLECDSKTLCRYSRQDHDRQLKRNSRPIRFG